MSEEYLLITGATGFIGSHVIEKLLLDKSYRLITIVRKSRNYKNVNDLRSKGVSLVEGNFYDKNLIEKIFEKFPVENVIHLAALRGGGAGTKRDYYEVNVHGTEALLEASFKNRVKRFIFCSSVGVFGTIPKKSPSGEATPYVPDNLYHQSKIEAERSVHSYIEKGLDAIIVRPTITYGEGDEGFPGTLVQLVKRKRFIMPKKEIRIHLVSVKKLAELFVLLINRKQLNFTVILGIDKKPITLREVADLIYIHFYGKPYPRYLQTPGFIFSLFLTASRYLQNEKWITRVRLISEDWFYQTVDLQKELDFQAADTELEFKKYLQSW